MPDVPDTDPHASQATPAEAGPTPTERVATAPPASTPNASKGLPDLNDLPAYHPSKLRHLR